MSILEEIKKKKTLILGFGKHEGPSIYRFLRRKFPEKVIGISDQKKPAVIPDELNITTNFGSNYLSTLEDYELIIKSSGVNPHLPKIVTAKSKGVVFTSITNIFFELCPGKIIGITGTKGKSTTASLIHHVLKENGFKTVLVGNIGTPSLDILPQISPDTWVVHELSSFQLMDLNFSPHIALLQSIYPDHLDYHTTFEEYKQAKYKITQFQTSDDYLICHESQKEIGSKAHKIVFSVADFDPIIKTSLQGEHNKFNIIPSILIGNILKIPKNKIYQSIATFQPLETRLTNVGEFHGITFYADTLATIPEATIAAIDTLNPATLIAGGFDRHQKYEELAQKILSSHIQTLILFPSTGKRIRENIEAILPSPNLGEGLRVRFFEVNSMKEAVELAFKFTPKNSTCLLSPGAPSFTLFKDYQDEFDQYKKYILAHVQ